MILADPSVGEVAEFAADDASPARPRVYLGLVVISIALSGDAGCKEW